MCILSVLAQVAIDRAKRNFDVDIQKEIKNIKDAINIKSNGYPLFWQIIRRDFNRDKINDNLLCPMNCIYNIKFPEVHAQESTLSIFYFLQNYEIADNIKVAKRIEQFICNYGVELSHVNYITDAPDDDYLLLRTDFDKLIEDIRSLTMPDKYVCIFSWLIHKAFEHTNVTDREKLSKMRKNRSLLMKTLYEVNPNAFITVFRGKNENMAKCEKIEYDGNFKKMKLTKRPLNHNE